MNDEHLQHFTFAMTYFISIDPNAYFITIPNFTNVSGILSEFESTEQFQTYMRVNYILYPNCKYLNGGQFNQMNPLTCIGEICLQWVEMRQTVPET